MACDRSVGDAAMKNRRGLFRESQLLRAVTFFLLIFFFSHRVAAQAVPYARTFAKSSEEVRSALQEMQAYAGQKLPIVEGFVAADDSSLQRFERAFYQFSIDLVPETAGGTIVRVTAKITAWYADRDPAKSGYQVLPSNGRLELDLLDRLSDKFSGASSRASLQSPRPKLDLPAYPPGASLPRPKVDAGSPRPSSESTPLSGSDELIALRAKRAAEDKRLQELNTELQNLQEIKLHQDHPTNLVAVKKNGTPVFARAGGAQVLFNAAADDEFEFLDAQSEWIHVQISGASRGYLRRSSVDLPEGIAARLHAAEENNAAKQNEVFRVTRQETGVFPGNWEALRGAQVRIFTVQPVSQDARQSGPAAKSKFAKSFFQKFAADNPQVAGEPAGVVIIFDSADGGIAAAPLPAIRQMAAGTVSRDNFWKACYFEPPESFLQSQAP
jgi:hypothetical protein